MAERIKRFIGFKPFLQLHLEWCDVSMQDGPTEQEQPRFFRSPAMTLLFKQPGELFARDTIVVEAAFEVPDVIRGAAAR